MANVKLYTVFSLKTNPHIAGQIGKQVGGIRRVHRSLAQIKYKHGVTHNQCSS